MSSGGESAPAVRGGNRKVGDCAAGGLTLIGVGPLVRQRVLDDLGHRDVVAVAGRALADHPAVEQDLDGAAATALELRLERVVERVAQFLRDLHRSRTAEGAARPSLA